MNHLMLDFETLGNTPDAAVVSLGACLFDKAGINERKLWHFDIQEQFNARRQPSADTIRWWLDQSAKAKNVFDKCKTEGTSMRIIGPEIVAMCKGKDVRAWGNGATFDVTIAEHILLQLRLEIPWKFWNIRCYRTLKNIADIEAGKKREGTHHNALDDSAFQAQNVIDYFKVNPKADR